MDEIVDWSDIELELLQRLGFCGCGMKAEALYLINDLLDYIDHRSRPYRGAFQGPDWKKHCQDDKDAFNKVITDNPDGVKYVLFYLIADKDITSHGGSVPGCLEDYEFRDKLKSYVAHINN
jgi:hypothetical protein